MEKVRKQGFFQLERDEGVINCDVELKQIYH